MNILDGPERAFASMIQITLVFAASKWFIRVVAMSFIFTHFYSIAAPETGPTFAQLMESNAFEELLDRGAAPAQLRWIFAVLAAEGTPALVIWNTHEQSLGADIEDSLLRTTPSPSPNLVMMTSMYVCRWRTVSSSNAAFVSTSNGGVPLVW
ncbi:hypothetical protein B0H13DRAFT_2332119 [Mycena leptocephala]|nr:hypothetical protein B0H13DRAFT_2332119 [Mycena leptocephala]